MNSSPHKLFQFRLAAIFKLTAIVAIIAWLKPPPIVLDLAIVAIVALPSLLAFALLLKILVKQTDS